MSIILPTEQARKHTVFYRLNFKAELVHKSATVVHCLDFVELVSNMADCLVGRDSNMVSQRVEKLSLQHFFHRCCHT